MALNPNPQDLVAETLNGVGIIASDRLDTAMYGEDPAQVPEFDQVALDTRTWCEEYGVSFYGAPGNEFDLDEATKVAREAGHSYVVVENLS